MKTETGLNQRMMSAIERHYKHAKEKHPYFCDMVAWKSFVIDGKKYKPDTWYTLKGDKVVEVKA